MPGRNIKLINNKFYHVYNRGIDHRPTFIKLNQYQRAVKTIWYYSYQSPPFRLSHFLPMSVEDKQKIINSLKNIPKLVEIICYCLMPNHFHFLLQQRLDNGISKFMSQFQNSYTRAFNTQVNRSGSLFDRQFKAVRVYDDEQLLHVSKYIHLNPLTGHVVKSEKELINFPWSSLPEYLMIKTNNICNLKEILSRFKSRSEYQQFILNEKTYQKQIKKIQHLMLDQLKNTEVS